MTRLTRFALAHKRLVLVVWAAMTLAGLTAAGRVSDALDPSVSVPASRAFETDQEIQKRFGSGGGAATLVAVVRLPAGTTAAAPRVRRDLRALERRFR